MAISNGNYSFNVGRDCSLVVMANTGRLDIPNLMEFDCRQETSNVRVDRLDGIQMNADLPKGFTGTITMERGNNGVDLLFSAIESAWLTGGSYQVATIYQYIAEADGSTSGWQYDSVALKYDDAGNWSGDKSVKQKISFTANRRRPV